MTLSLIYTAEAPPHWPPKPIDLFTKSEGQKIDKYHWSSSSSTQNLQSGAP